MGPPKFYLQFQLCFFCTFQFVVFGILVTDALLYDTVLFNAMTVKICRAERLTAEAFRRVERRFADARALLRACKLQYLRKDLHDRVPFEQADTISTIRLAAGCTEVFPLLELELLLEL